MKKLHIFLLAATAALAAGSAFAHEGWRDGYDDHDRWERRDHRHWDEGRRYEAPVVIYPAPPVIYRERVVYQERPIYYEAPRYYERPAYPRYSGDRMAGQVAGAVVGGVVGSRFGQGNGQVAATAIGAVIGSMVGGDMAGYR
ncbi:MAG TPA: glycine zipper 2TM domain-containing protein [Rhodocyclaceae bacterium]|nr:glycine zipper 2TM domain-containing protein [Rhodocyclaceae bacterium]